MDNFCPEHTNIAQSLGRIEGKVDRMIAENERVNGTFIRHVQDSDVFRTKVIHNEEIIKALAEERVNSVKASQWRIALIVGVVMSVLTILSRIFIK